MCSFTPLVNNQHFESYILWLMIHVLLAIEVRGKGILDKVGIWIRYKLDKV